MEKSRSVVGMLVAAALGLSSAARAQPPRAGASSLASLDQAFERSLMKKTHGHGALVPIHRGRPGGTTAILVHGIPGAPSSLAPLMESEIDAGSTVHAFAYDNRFRSLEESSADLAASIERWMDEHPQQPLRLDAHSMGGRLALGALDLLGRRHRLNRAIELNLIASPIAGTRSAVFALAAPVFLPFMRPLRGVAPTSQYQKMIDALRLPECVTVRVFVGGSDRVFEQTTKRYRHLVETLHGTLSVVADATHTSILDGWLTCGDTFGPVCDGLRATPCPFLGPDNAPALDAHGLAPQRDCLRLGL